MTLTMTQAQGASLTITPLGTHAGAEATGVDLSRPVDAETRRRLQDALRRHVALVVRDQQLTADQYAEAIKVFGQPMKQNFKGEKLDSQDVVKLVSNAIPGKSGQRVYHASYWHTDHTNREIPPQYTALYAVELPKMGGGDTGVTNTRAAYANLPATLKARIDGLQTVNVFSGSAARNKSHKAVVLERVIEEKPAVHPLVVTDPVNGQKAIYLHQGKLENFVGLTPEASHELVGELMAEVVKPEYVYRHKWRTGDLLIWDDRASMHQAYTDYDLNDTRVLWRIIVEGQKPA